MKYIAIAIVFASVSIGSVFEPVVAFGFIPACIVTVFIALAGE